MAVKSRSPDSLNELRLNLRQEGSRGAGGRREGSSQTVQRTGGKRQEINYQHAACQESFVCKVCGREVLPEGAGSQYRNHCPSCLSSIHADNRPGDRASLCKGVMEPIGVWVRKNQEWAIIHRCRACGALSSNRIAADDNPNLLMSIAVKPLAMPPFPLGQLQGDTK